MMNGTIFLAKQKYEYKHLALYITFTYIKFIYVIALLQDTCIFNKYKFLLGGGTRYENTQRFFPGEGRCKFLHKYKISLGGGGGGINSLVNLQVFLYLPKFFWGKNKADQT